MTSDIAVYGNLFFGHPDLTAFCENFRDLFLGPGEKTRSTRTSNGLENRDLQPSKKGIEVFFTNVSSPGKRSARNGMKVRLRLLFFFCRDVPVLFKRICLIS